MAIMELSVVPIGTATTSLSQYVAKAVQILTKEKDIKYELTAMGTIIEGDVAHLLTLVKRMHQSAFDAGAKRVLTTIKIDERRDKPSTISSKVESVKRKLSGTS